MKLCTHLQELYKRELARGNTVLSVSTPDENSGASCRLIVEMNQKLCEDYPDIDIKPKYYRCDISTMDYKCEQCACALSGPLYEDGPRWKPSEDKANPRVLATSENVYVEDDYYDMCMMPTLMSEARKKEIDDYWSAHSEQKQALNEEQAKWEKIRDENGASAFVLDMRMYKKTEEAQKQLQKLKERDRSLEFYELKKHREVKEQQKEMEEQISAIKSEYSPKISEHLKLKAKAEQHIQDIEERLAMADRFKG